MGHPTIWGMGLGRDGTSSPSPPLPHPPLVIPGKMSHPPLKLTTDRVGERIERVIERNNIYIKINMYIEIGRSRLRCGGRGVVGRKFQHF